MWLRLARRKSKKQWSVDGSVAVAVGLSALVFYLPFLPQTVSFEDSAEFVTAAATLGFTHPSGSPLYVILSQPFVHLPFGSLPWRVAFFSAVCAAATVGMLFLVAAFFAKTSGIRFGWAGRFAVAAVCFRLAVAETWFAQAVYAKNYALLALLLAIGIYALLRSASDADSRLWPRLAALSLGLAAANHLFLTAVVAPFFLVALLVARPALRRRPASAAGLLVWFLLGVAPVVFLLVRPFFGPYVSFGGPIAGFGDFARFLFRTAYNDVGVVSGWNTIGLTFDVVGRLFAELGPVSLGLAAVGAWRLSRGQRPAWTLAISAVGLVVTTLLVSVLRSADWTAVTSYVYRIFVVPGCVGLTVLAACGAAWAIAALGAKSRLGQSVVAALLALVPLAAAGTALPTVLANADPFPERYISAVLDSLPPRAVLVVQDAAMTDDTELFVAAYLMTVTGQRRDVAIIHDTTVTAFGAQPDLPVSYFQSELAERRASLLTLALLDSRWSGRPIYATFSADAATRGAPSGSALSGLRYRSNGLAYRVLRPGESPDESADQALRTPPLPRSVRPELDFGLSYLFSHALYAYAAGLVDSGYFDEAQTVLGEALTYDAAPMSADYVAFMAHRAAVPRVGD